MSQDPEKFVWPPKPLPTEAAGAPRASQSERVAERNATGLVERTVATLEMHPVAPWRFWLRDVERTWLGQTRAPFALRAHDVAWAPESPTADVYCPRCARTVGPHEVTLDDRDITCCSECRGTKLPWSRAVRLGPYRGLLRDAIHETKFHAWRRLGADLGELLGRALRESLVAENIDPASAVLVPVPSTYRRTLSRGIDHAMAIARGVRSTSGVEIVRALARRHRPSQLSVPHGERRRNVAGSMRRRDGFDLAGRLAIVVDDVMTTGATATEACRALIDGGPRGSGAVRTNAGKKGHSSPSVVWVAVLGVTPPRGRD